MGLRSLVVGLVALLGCSAYGSTQIPSPPFLAFNAQGRPLVGGSVSVTVGGVPATVYGDVLGATPYSGIVPATGIVQFFGAPAQYVVSVSAQGTSLVFYAQIAPSSGAITDANFANATAGLLQKTATSTYQALKTNYFATVDPTVNNDNTQGYFIGSEWVNVNSNTIFFCTNNSTGAAVWSTPASSLTSINGQSGPAITLVVGSAGTDFNIAASANTITLNIPSASATARGLLTTGAQTIAGAKVFTSSIQAGGGILAQTLTYPNAFQVASDKVLHFSSNTGLPGYSIFEAPTGANAAIYAISDDSGNGVTGQGGNALLNAGVAGFAGTIGEGVLGTSTHTGSFGGLFTRSVNSSSVAVLGVTRNASSDATSLIGLADATATTTAPYAVDYALNSVRKWGLGTGGQYYGTFDTTSDPVYSFLGDTDSGLTENSGHIALVADSNIFLYGFYSAGAFTVATGQLSIGAQAGNNQKILCVKGDGFIGTCSGSYSTGSCTCA